AAEKLGADAVSTTLSGYTPYSPQLEGPDLDIVGELSAVLRVPLIAEGRIGTPEDLRAVMALGAWSAVVGSAITRPQLITRSFVRALEKD
ncbi:MAG: N-acetylmannosamine-6-phosphate 2-epimerase, partial [Schwartzia sp.]|nr:N-acetylmannosamine-6-phosphate 2-epimerase [Schwartzia sp. (in: firmicutes)]